MLYVPSDRPIRAEHYANTSISFGGKFSLVSILVLRQKDFTDLSPFIDENGFPSVGGRLIRAAFAESNILTFWMPLQE